MGIATGSAVAVRPIELEFTDRRTLVAAAQATGSALLEGWSDGDPWTVLLPWPEEIESLEWSELGHWRQIIDRLDNEDPIEDLFSQAPFLGGWIGFICYELGAVEEAAPLPERLPPEPPIFFARHRSGLLRSEKETWLFAPADSMDAYEERLLGLLSSRAPAPASRLEARMSDSFPGNTFCEGVEQIREAIARGDVYQTNLTRRFTADPADPADLYLALTEPDPPRCSAFIRGDGWTIASASPELFLQFDRLRGVAESRPIKGTVRRTGHDEAEIAALLSSRKDSAEHLMIVDLVRNDLGKVAPGGRVSVADYRTVRTLPHVHHLESTVRAEGLESVTLADLIGALFPGGSITGAPKRAAVGMIHRLEPVARGIYTGAIGFHDLRGRTELSVAIRTAVVTPQSTRYHAGGGIVWESDAAAEDDESLAKSIAFLRYFGVDRE